MAKAKIIVNPYSGRWKGPSSVPAVEAALKEAGVDFDLVCTAGPDHAIELAREAALGGYSPVVAAGGDGTIGEVVNGLMQAAGGQVAGSLAIIPLGSAGELDFIFAGGLSRLQILRFLPEVMRRTHLDKDPVTYGRTRHIVIASDDPLPVVADGEIMTTEAHRLEIEVLPGRMQVLC